MRPFKKYVRGGLSRGSAWGKGDFGRNFGGQWRGRGGRGRGGLRSRIVPRSQVCDRVGDVGGLGIQFYIAIYNCATVIADLFMVCIGSIMSILRYYMYVGGKLISRGKEEDRNDGQGSKDEDPDIGTHFLFGFRGGGV